MEENLKDTSNPARSLKGLKLNKTVLLVAGLVILTGILLAISLSTKKSSPIPILTRDQETDIAHTSLSISDELRSSSLSGTYEVDVNIDSSDNRITGAQLEITYDPKVLTKVDIKPGEFLPDPVVILKKIDVQNGKISYVIGSQLGENGVEGAGSIAVITFSKVGSQETTIDFLPQTLITAEGSDQSVLKESVSGIISILPSSGDTNSSR
ncbi:MAG: hypothetical protein ACD_37C00157G0002 [uncultured bacterium]|nr:MAG: hypothetical protein ACD_37C00157G0002 [uncultured bacterium]